MLLEKTAETLACINELQESANVLIVCQRPLGSASVVSVGINIARAWVKAIRKVILEQLKALGVFLSLRNSH